MGVCYDGNDNSGAGALAPALPRGTTSPRGGVSPRRYAYVCGQGGSDSVNHRRKRRVYHGAEQAA